MNNPRTKRLPKIILGQALVSALILIIASYLVIYSMGYKINFSARTITKTGLIVLSISPKPDQILLNGKEQTVKSDVAMSLEPGYYDLSVSKDGYQSWSVRSNVKAELVNYYKYIELFKKDVQLSPIADQKKIDIVNAPSNSLAANSPQGLVSSQFEIWLNGKLVTRFSQPIYDVSWFPDNHHLVFQKGNQIEIVEDTGLNETTLVTLSSDKLAKYAIGANGSEIYVYQDGQYLMATIQ